MRRLAVVLALSIVMPAAPGAKARAPEPALVPLVKGGTHSILPIRPGEELLRRLEPLAVTPEGDKVLQRIARTVRPDSHEGEPHHFTTLLEAPDLNGDGSTELVVMDSEYTWDADLVLDGDTTYTVFDARRGLPLWKRTFTDFPLAIPAFVRVGGDLGRPGLVALGAGGDLGRSGGLRIVSLGGARGETVYDRSIDASDGLGEVSFGGFLDAVPNGGTEVLIARTQYLGVRANVTIAGLRWPEADLSQVFVVDGRNGRIFAGSERMVGLGGYVKFVAGGDHDKDKRDDFLIFRWGLHGRGTVTARSLSEERVLWVNESVPLGNMVHIPVRKTDMVGDARDDLFFETRVNEFSLVVVPGVTDEMVLFGHDPDGTHGILLDGKDGSVELDRWDADEYLPIADVTGDRKSDILVLDVFLEPRRAGLVFSVGRPNAGDVYTREVSLPVDVPIAASMGAALVDAGDVDGDRVADYWYDLAVGTTSLTLRQTRGFLLTRTGRTLTTSDFPLSGTLDNRGTDRFTAVTNADGGGESFQFRDGLTGKAYWRLHTRTPDADSFLAPVAVHGARGRRCANVVLVSVGVRSRRGEIHGFGLDGRTGKVVWSRALSGPTDIPVVAPRGGAPAPCA